MSVLRKIQKSLVAQHDKEAKEAMREALKTKRAIHKALRQREKERESRSVKLARRR